MTDSTDILIVGGGMSGLCAALAARETGASVTVLEADTEVGGSARWSAGTMWTYLTYEEMRATIPQGRADLQRLIVDTLPGCFDWLASKDLPLVDAVRDRGGGKVMNLGGRGNRREFMFAMAARAEAAGARIALGCRVRELRGNAGAFTATIDAGGKSETLDAKAVILASGGFQANRDLLKSYLGPTAAHLMLRTNPFSRGDGLLMGLVLGAGVSRSLGSFYGHTMPLHADKLAPTDYKEHTLSMSPDAILVNAEGMRFVDEAELAGEETNPGAGMHQPGGRYFMIFDAQLAPKVPITLLQQLARNVGVDEHDILIGAPSANDLADDVQRRWGIPADRLKQTLLQAREPATLVPRRSKPLAPLVTAPFYAIACIPSITFTYGGLEVDPALSVQGRDGQPIAGLWASGCDAGGVYSRIYGGGLIWALVTGRAAGRAGGTFARALR